MSLLGKAAGTGSGWALSSAGEPSSTAPRRLAEQAGSQEAHLLVGAPPSPTGLLPPYDEAMYWRVRSALCPYNGYGDDSEVLDEIALTITRTVVELQSTVTASESPPETLPTGGPAPAAERRSRWFGRR